MAGHTNRELDKQKISEPFSLLSCIINSHHIDFSIYDLTYVERIKHDKIKLNFYILLKRCLNSTSEVAKGAATGFTFQTAYDLKGRLTNV